MTPPGRPPSARAHARQTAGQTRWRVETCGAPLAEPCVGGRLEYGGTTDATEPSANPRTGCLPEALLDGAAPACDSLPGGRRKLVAQ